MTARTAPLRWLILQSNGAHQGGPDDAWAPNWFLRECFSWQDALMRLGCIAHVAGPGHPPLDGAIHDYDVVLYAEQYDHRGMPPIGGIRAPLKIHWIVDLHVQGAPRYEAISRECQVVLHATRSLMADYAKLAPDAKHLWCPNAVDDRYFRPSPLLIQRQQTSLLFIGGKGNDERGQLLDRMIAEAKLDYRYGVTGYPYIQALQQTQIGFNVPVAGDINYRTFEVPATGACLLTQNDPDLADLGFKHGENCWLYEDADDAVRLAQRLVANGSYFYPGLAGTQLVMERHTYEARIRDLFRQMEWM